MRKYAKKIWQNEFFRGSLFFTFSSFLINFLNYLFNFIAGRSLGPQGYSEITALFSYISITAVPTSVLSTFLIHRISSAGDERFKFAHSMEQLFYKKLIRWWPVILLFLFLSPLTPRITNLSPFAGMILIPLILVSFVGTFYSSTIQGLKLFFYISMLSVIGTLIKLLGALFTMLDTNGVNTIIIFIIGATVVPLVLSIFMLHAYLRKKVAIPLPAVEKRVLSLFSNRQFLLILFSTLAVTLFNNIDIVVVKKFLPSTDAGIYSSWSIFAKIIFYAIGPLISISFIFFSDAKNNKFQHRALNLSLIFLLIVGIVSFLVYKNLGSFVVNMLFGDKFKPVVPYLSLASLFGSLYAGIAFLNSYFVAKKDKFSLILPVFLPLYILLLFFGEKDVGYIMKLNIVFSFCIVVLYLLAYVRSVKKSFVKLLS